MDEFSGSLIDHLGIGVSDISHARAFYEQALKPLGITLLASIEATLRNQLLGDWASALLASHFSGCMPPPPLASGRI